jgi:hypothetical protein
LISGPAGLFSFGGALTQPLFAGGRIHNGVRLAEAQEEEAVLLYKQTIQRAFQDVSDSLVGYTKDQEFRKQQELLTAAAQDAAHLSDIRYKGGAARGAFGFAFSISAMSRDVGDVGDVGDSSALPSPVIPRSKGLSSPHPNRPSCGTAAPGCGLPLSLLNADR